MATVRRSHVYETLVASLPVDGAALFQAALNRAGLKDRPVFKPEEVARLGETMMAIAREQAQYALDTEPSEAP